MTGSRVRLVVLFGGQSAEHDVSCVSARHVLAAVDPARYAVEPVGITRDGAWVRAEDAMAALARGTDALPDSLKAVGPDYDLLPAMHGALQEGEQVVVLPVLHGPMGEDGTVQGFLELAGVPYVGCGVLGSALTMDKAKAKEVLAHAGIPQCAHRSFHAPQWSPTLADELIDQLGLPAFVKPANMGSSIGVSKATDRQGLITAVELALTYDEWIVVEEAVEGRELECSVLGNDEPRVSLPGEIVPGDEFYSYDDKYHDEAAGLVVPAELPDDVVVEMQELAADAFRVLRCEGLARADFFYEEHGRGLLLNELNTMPGFTPISMYPKLWAASGVSYPELIDELVELALQRHARRRRRTDH
ncbi:MAG: D-alanine--D-alanine ligase [Acidimicrobiia bacterium]|nr:D-alanine--D-alanine ligase [Acidimicrobiia bacterium]